MATPSFIRVPPDSTGKKVDMCSLDVSGDTVERQRFQVAGDASNAIAPVTTEDGLSVSTAITTPVVDHVSALSIAAGGTADLDSSQISSGLTGKLIHLIVSASVPFKAEVKTVQNNVASAVKVTGFGWTNGWEYRAVSKKFLTIAEDVTAGLDGFRVTVTNLDTSEAANLYATFLYDTE